jgi:hypothetical protein
MRPIQDIKKRIKRVPINTNTERDKQVLDDVLNALEQSRKAQSPAHRVSLWRFVMRSTISRLAAVVFVIAALVGVSQLDSAHAAFVRTTKAVSTGLAGLKEFIREIRRGKPEPPSAVPPADSNKQETAFHGRSIRANVRTISVDGGWADLQDFFKREGLEWTPAGNDPNVCFVKLDPGRTERFVACLTQTAAGLKIIASPGLMVKEGEQGVIAITGAQEQDAVALALAATVSDDGDSIDLSFSFLHGRNGFEVPSLRINADGAVLLRLVTAAPAQNEQRDQDSSDGQDTVLVLVQTKVLPQT